MKRVFVLALIALMLYLPSAQAVVGMDAFVVDTESSETDNNFVPIPAAYEVYTTIKNLGEAGFMNHPEDLYLAPDDTVYVADGENNRVLQMNRDGQVLRIIEQACGKKLNKPRGVFVHPDGSIWIADTGNLRIATINADLSDRKEYVKHIGVVCALAGR